MKTLESGVTHAFTKAFATTFAHKNTRRVGCIYRLNNDESLEDNQEEIKVNLISYKFTFIFYFTMFLLSLCRFIIEMKMRRN